MCLFVFTLACLCVWFVGLLIFVLLVINSVVYVCCLPGIMCLFGVIFNFILAVLIVYFACFDCLIAFRFGTCLLFDCCLFVDFGLLFIVDLGLFDFSFVFVLWVFCLLVVCVVLDLLIGLLLIWLDVIL